MVDYLKEAHVYLEIGSKEHHQRVFLDRDDYYLQGEYYYCKIPLLRGKLLHQLAKGKKHISNLEFLIVSGTNKAVLKANFTKQFAELVESTPTFLSRK